MRESFPSFEKSKMNYYETLSVSRSATSQEIKTAFRKLAMQWHPDRNHDPGAEEKFKEISEANDVLSDEIKRRSYDTTLPIEAPSGSSFGRTPSQENIAHANNRSETMDTSLRQRRGSNMMSERMSTTSLKDDMARHADEVEARQKEAAHNPTSSEREMGEAYEIDAARERERQEKLDKLRKEILE